MQSRQKGVVLLVLVAAAFFVVACWPLVSDSMARQRTLRFTIVKKTPGYVVAERLSERVVVRKGSHFVATKGVGSFVVVKLTGRYVYLQRVASAVGEVNIKDYSATGDGRSDDRAAVARACAAAVGKTLYVPAGTYRIGARLTIPNGVTVRGDGDASWLNGPVTVGSNTTFASLRMEGGYSCYLGGVSRVTFTKVRFTGGGGSYKGTWPHFDCHVLTIGVGGSVADVLF